MIKIGCMSDLHGYVWGLSGKTYPEVELLILAGDIADGEDSKRQEDWYINNFYVLKDKNIFPDLQEIFIVPGNHDVWLERNYQSPPRLYEILGPEVKVLVDERRDFTSFTNGEKVRVWGNPRTSLYTFAFPHLAGYLDLQMIPKDGSIDILVTHEAPRLFGLPCIKGSMGDYGNELPGNQALANTVLEVKPKYHIFGHIHYPCQSEVKGIKFMNVSQQKRPGDIYTPELHIIEYGEEEDKS